MRYIRMSPFNSPPTTSNIIPSGRTTTVDLPPDELLDGLPLWHRRNKPLPVTPKPSKANLRRVQTTCGSRSDGQSRYIQKRPASAYEVRNLFPLQLDVEILEHILCFLDNKTLAVIARTCKAISPLAYQALYTTVVLKSPSHHTRLQRPHVMKRYNCLIYTLHHSDQARAALRHLSLESSTETPLHAYDFLRKIQLLVSLSVHVAPPVFGVVYDAIKASEHLMTTILRCPALRTLCTFIHMGHDSLFSDTSRLSHFLSRTPELSRLSIILPNQLGPLESSSPTFPPTRALRYATIISPKFDGTLISLLRAISRSIVSLELLVVHAITKPAEASSALYSLGTGLKYLSFHASTPPADYRFLDSLPCHLQGLRALYLSRGTCTSAILDNLHRAKGLKYLAFAGCLPDVVEERKVVELLSSSRAGTSTGQSLKEVECNKHGGRTRSLKPKLRQLVLYPLVNQAGDAQLCLDSPLFDACKRAGVKLILQPRAPAQFSYVGFGDLSREVSHGSLPKPVWRSREGF
ncbi:hypothetical protein WG66_002903 [Moniliophthora roreri]|nr:hypothetical protein WG66_002903 [Moniliophthora roreri]